MSVSDNRRIKRRKTILDFSQYNTHTDEELISLLKTKTKALFVQGSLKKQVDETWMEVYSLVFLLSTKEYEETIYEILCDLFKTPPTPSLNFLSDVKILSNRKDLLFLIWVINKSAPCYVQRELKLKIFAESMNVDIENGHKVLFTSFSYLTRYWIPNQNNYGNVRRLWGNELISSLNNQK